ncbi:amidase [Halococcus agarilyticus]|uniref:amidase n=1 Tax=Halococcus agarilyticus TaxID=1232219 RepID=UPI0006780751|nr:amidase family protein [Halococcus agarilyticus]
MTTETTHVSATQLAAEIRRGERSPIDAVDAVFERIERNDDLNAFVQLREAEAREEAAEAAQAIENGEPVGPLHGVPIALKDLDSFIEGMPCTYGSKPFADHVPDRTTVIVERLLDAGAIVVGSTNTPEFGHKGDTTNPLFGATGNPFDPSKTAGGSSGGSAAAVAAGMVPIALGSDAGGSIRIPASACGVYGLKPTAGLVPEDSRPDALESAAPFICLGGLTTTVADTALLLDIVAGDHPRDPLSVPDERLDYLAATNRAIDDLSIAYSPDFGVFPLEDEVAARVDTVVDTLERAGATVERTDPDFEPSFDEMMEAEYVTFETVLASTAESLERREGVDLLPDHREDLSPKLVQLMENGYDHSAVAFKQADVVRTATYDAIQNVLDDHDLLLTATLGVPPFEKGRLGPETVNGEPIDPHMEWLLTWPLNLTGQPAASVPAGLSDDGLPIGAQLVGPRFGEEELLAASAAIERRQPWVDDLP